jgi:hypothetical protein
MVFSFPDTFILAEDAEDEPVTKVAGVDASAGNTEQGS